MVSGDVDLGKQLALVRTFTLIRSTSSTPHLENGYFSGRKVEFYIPRNELPLAVIQAILIKTFGGTGTFSEAICPILYEDIPLNYSDPGTAEKIDSNIKGSDMKLYKVPWSQMGAEGKSNPGRALDWSKTIQGNGLSVRRGNARLVTSGHLVIGRYSDCPDKVTLVPLRPGAMPRRAAAIQNWQFPSRVRYDAPSIC